HRKLSTNTHFAILIACTTTVSQKFCIIFYNHDTATTEIYTLSLHDALPISRDVPDIGAGDDLDEIVSDDLPLGGHSPDEVGHLRSEEHSLNSSHDQISYAVFCLKKKNEQEQRKNQQPQRQKNRLGNLTHRLH